MVPLITPLWTAFIDQELGILFRRITYDAIHLAWAKDMLLEYNIELDSFEPLVAVIVTWLDFDLPTSTPQSVSIALCMPHLCMHNGNYMCMYIASWQKVSL